MRRQRHQDRCERCRQTIRQAKHAPTATLGASRAHTHPATDPAASSLSFRLGQEFYIDCGCTGVSAANRNRLRRKALPITETELSDIASAATIGLSSKPTKGYSTPAASGTPMAL